MNRTALPIMVLSLLASVWMESGAAEPLVAQKRFNRVFAWISLDNENDAALAANIGITDATCNPAKINMLHKYGIRGYPVFSPCGPQRQVLTLKEKELDAWITGQDIPPPKRLDRNATAEQKEAYTNAMAEYRQKLVQRKLEAKHQHGGEPRPDAPRGDIHAQGVLPCFTSDTDYAASKQALDKLLEIKEIDGIAFDYIGYTNFRCCHCWNCEAKHKLWLLENKFQDSQAKKDEFFRKCLVDYYNELIDYIKSRRAELQVMVHIYPVFLPDPLYGNRTKADWCGQTVSWYFLWPEQKIRDYTKKLVSTAHNYFPEVTQVPFIGFSNNTAVFDKKDPARIEMELKAILESGADTFMICSGGDFIKNPDLCEVLKKFTRRN